MFSDVRHNAGMPLRARAIILAPWIIGLCLGCVSERTVQYRDLIGKYRYVSVTGSSPHDLDVLMLRREGEYTLTHSSPAGVPSTETGKWAFLSDNQPRVVFGDR